MYRQDLLDKLQAAIETAGAGWRAEHLDEFPSLDVVLKTPCFAAFFGVVEEPRNIGDIYKKVQSEIVSVCGDKSWPRDLELVLLVTGATPPTPASVREIIDDRYICRKFILYMDSRDIRDVLADLPFWPPGDLLSGAPTSVAASVQEAVRGHDPRLIADLASHRPGAERICEKIQERKYSLRNEPSTSELVRLPRVARSAVTKLMALDITDFRGIRRLQSEDMPLSGDVIFIYGPNGVGKTSIADAVEWAISGQIGRLDQVSFHSMRGGPDPIVNVFSEKREARVTCHLSDCDHICRIKRDRSMDRLIGSHRAVDDRAVIDHVVGTRAPTHEARLGIGRLRDLFRGSHMLSQYDIRQFLEHTDPIKRFDILTNMIGAEEFVRFREKVATVLRHLYSRSGALAEDSKSLKRALDDISTKLRERQKEFEGLSHAVTAGKTPEELATELLQGLKSCQCKIDETAIERTALESAEHRFNLIAVHAETAIRAKKAAIEDLLVRLKSLDQDLQGYVESRMHCQSLQAELVIDKLISEKASADLQQKEKAPQDIHASLQVLKTKQSEVARRCVDLIWLKENLPAYHLVKKNLRRMEASLIGQRKEIQRFETALDDQQKSLNVKRVRLQEIEQTMVARTTREHAIFLLLEQLHQVLTKQEEAEQLGNEAMQFDSRIAELRQQASLVIGEVNAVHARLEDLQKTYNSEAARHDEVSSFLAKLAELVRSAECPLCGRVFATAEEAKDNIQKHLSTIPIELKIFARRLDETRKDAETKQTQVGSILTRIRATEAQFEDAKSRKMTAIKVVKDFLAECSNLGIIISVKDTVSWQNTLEEARKECVVTSLGSEASTLRDTIQSLVSRAEGQQNVIDELRQKIVRDEKEFSRLVAEAQGFEADMIQRGFDPSLLPQTDRLDTDLSKVQDESIEYNELVGKREDELKSVELEISGLREHRRKADEDVASKEVQFRQYETICNRFIASCRALGVDPENARESIGDVRRVILELNQSLSALEEKRLVLQQVINLGTLKREIDGLTLEAGNVKQQYESYSLEESNLRKWLSHLKSLESEVIRQQVDVVSSHLQRLEPIMQQLYCRLNPHPIFGKVRIKVEEKTRKLEVEAEVSVALDHPGDITVSPSVFFSTAQMNTLAITVFLAGALRQRWSGFNTILIDDPVQQMDEMNVCAFLDLIRGLSSRRQFIIFTCSREFYLLALEKLACLNKFKPGTFLAYRLEGIAPSELKVHCDTPGQF